MSLFGPVRRGGRWILIGVGIYGVATVLFAGSHVFWFSVLMLAVSGAGDTTSAILRSTINQLSTPDELRGRMSSINAVFTSSGPQLGQFESGVVAAWLGTEASAMTGGLATLIILAVVAACFPAIRRFQIQWDLLHEHARRHYVGTRQPTASIVSNRARPIADFCGRSGKNLFGSYFALSSRRTSLSRRKSTDLVHRNLADIFSVLRMISKCIFNCFSPMMPSSLRALTMAA